MADSHLGTPTHQAMKLILSLSLLLSATAPAADWPMWRGPNGDGTTSESGLPEKWSPTENVVWKTELPGAGTSSPNWARSRST